MKHLLIIIAFIFTTISANIALAQEYHPLQPLPGTYSGEASAATTNMAQYISGSIKLLIALGAGLAILFAIIAGTQYVAASINPAAKAGALEKVQNALIGLIIILTSYLLLNSINPKLLEFNLTLDPVAIPQTATEETVASLCPVTPLTPLEGKALEMENGEKVIWEAGAEAADQATTNSNLAKTKIEVDRLKAALSKEGLTAEATSAYRPYAYQKHLYELHIKWVGGGQNQVNLKDLNEQVYPECINLKKEVEAERTKHGILGLVADPLLGNAPHIVGTGVDIVLRKTGSTTKDEAAYTTINDLMEKNGINLKWQNASNDIVHFNYFKR